VEARLNKIALSCFITFVVFEKGLRDSDKRVAILTMSVDWM
jgi:hypothetical protein